MKRFELTVTIEDGKLNFESKNDGFGSLELLGILSWKHRDIIDQLEGKVKPDAVTRNYIEEEQ